MRGVVGPKIEVTGIEFGPMGFAGVGPDPILAAIAYWTVITKYPMLFFYI